jgi:glycosyltransferase involved in cell wall biosynthesis
VGGRLVSVGFPVRNGEHRVQAVVESVLAQDHTELEIIISDNASTDGTEEVCRSLAKSDERVSYHRQRENIGLLRNFAATMELAQGEYFRWISHDDSLAPDYVSTLLDVLAGDERLLLVTSQIEYELDDGSTVSQVYNRPELGSDDPATRFTEMLRLMNEGFATLDPVYGLMRRAPVATLTRKNLLFEDEVFAARLALLGPWGHVPQVLATRGWSYTSRRTIAERLDVPRWQVGIAWELQVRELLRATREAELDAQQRRRARVAIARLYTTRHRRRIERLVRKLRPRNTVP